MKKKVDERIRTLIQNGVKSRHRSMFFIIGDKFRDQIVNLHYILRKSDVKTTPSVLWCYKDKLEISSHKKKRAKQVGKLQQRGLFDPEKTDSFSRFMNTASITFCLYKKSEKILGNTFGMCILQDFEALTPNLLARTIETVEGGGIILVLLHSLTSLTSLYTMVMDVHDRFRTESHSEASGRFNERFLLSLASCKACCVMDDELNILPISSHIRSIAPIPVKEDSEGLSEAKRDLKDLKVRLSKDIPVGPLIKKCCTLDQGSEGLSEAERDLKDLKVQLSEDFPVGPLIKKCCTLDQGRAVITFLDAILDKTLRNTIALLAARGRGKSAALGLAIAGAVAAGYSNIFVTAPSPENLKTLFDFVCKGFKALKYKKRIDYDVVESSQSEFSKPIVRINISKQHRQTIQYILPHESEKLSQVDLLVVDEAAAIPLPVVKSLLGPYLVFLSSTVNGYEGTGRSLSLKLIQQLEERSRITANSDGNSVSGRLFKKIELTESIRYASGDPIESWLSGLLCLDVANHIPNISRLPPPGDCDLFYVNRDTLFSYHKDSELFLQRMMALYVASHYKNSPNDLQLMADAPAHHLFVLLGPVDESKNQLPDILCVIQVCLEGQISRKSVLKSLSEGHQPFGDQIPWKFSEQFQDTVFPTLSGARIVRIATHPSAMRLGYGSAAVGLLSRYFEGQLAPTSEAEVENTEADQVRVTEAAHKASLLEENIHPRKNLPPLLVNLQDRRPEKLHYLGVSFGLTLDLFRFWRKHKFVPFYVGQIQNTVTGEHTCMVLKPLNSDDIEDSGSDEWAFLSPFYRDFKQRFAKLLAYGFRDMEYKLAMSLVDPKINFNDDENDRSSSDGFVKHLKEIITPHDLKRLEAYTNNLADYHMILDIVPTLSHLYFQEKLPVSMTYAQASILLCIGLQHRDFTYLEGQMKLERGQIMSLFMKVMNKFNKYLYSVASKEIEAAQPRIKEVVLPSATLMTSLDDDLKDGARKVQDEMKTQAAMLGLSDGVLQQYAITGGEADFEKALQGKHGKISSGSVISVKSNRRDHSEKRRGNEHKHGGKRSSDHSHLNSNKKSKH